MIGLRSILLVTFLLIQGCGFQAVHKIERGNYALIKIENTGDKKISRYLERNFAKFELEKDSKHMYELIANSKIDEQIKSRNTAGIAENLNLKIVIEIIIKEKGEVIGEKSFVENVSYSNLKNKFELNKYEKIIIEDQVKKMINKINFFVASLK